MAQRLDTLVKMEVEAEVAMLSPSSCDTRQSPSSLDEEMSQESTKIPGKDLQNEVELLISKRAELACQYLENHQPDEAKVILAEAISLMKTAQEINPNLCTAIEVLVRKIGDIGLAEGLVLVAALRANDPNKKCACLLQLAKNKMERKQYVDAVVLFREALTLGVLNSDAVSQVLLEIAKCQENDGKVMESVTTFLQLLKLEPKNYKTHLKLGILLLKVNVRDRALFFLNEALRLNPNDTQILYHIAKTLIADDNTSHAKELLQKCCRDDPKRDEYWALLGTVFAGEKKIPEAFECFRRAIALNYNSLSNYTNLAGLYELNGQVDDAVNLYTEIVRRFPGDKTAAQKLKKLTSNREKDSSNSKFTLPEQTM